MENKMEKVAQLLGVELEEKFRIEGFPTKYRLTKDGLIYWDDYNLKWIGSCGLEELLIGKRQIVKIPKPILTEEEKEYLSAVIKPFRDRVTVIIKHKCDYSQDEYLGIGVRYYNKAGVKEITLPIFEKDTMYKGMDSTMWYTLEELGL